MFGWLPATFKFLEFFQFFLLKLVYFWTKSRKNIYGRFFHSLCATYLNLGIKNWKNEIINFTTSDFCKLLRLPISPILQIQNFLWVCWFFCKNLSNFVYPVCKLLNPYCHNFHISYHTYIWHVHFQLLS